MFIPVLSSDSLNYYPHIIITHILMRRAGSRNGNSEIFLPENSKQKLIEYPLVAKMKFGYLFEAPCCRILHLSSKETSMADQLSNINLDDLNIEQVKKLKNEAIERLKSASKMAIEAVSHQNGSHFSHTNHSTSAAL
jgi:hypothetical protein